MILRNAIAVLQRFLRRAWTINISALNLILQDESGRHVLTVAKNASNPLIREIRNFIALIKRLFVPRRIKMPWQGPERVSGRSYAVIDRKEQNGNVWLCLADTLGRPLWRLENQLA